MILLKVQKILCADCHFSPRTLSAQKDLNSISGELKKLLQEAQSTSCFRFNCTWPYCKGSCSLSLHVLYCLQGLPLPNEIKH